MTVQEYETKLEHIVTEYTKVYDEGDPTAGGWVIREIGKLRDQWLAELLGEDEIWEHESGYYRNLFRADLRKRAGLPEK